MKSDRHRRRWSAQEDARLMTLRREGLQYKAIGELMGRSRQGVQRRYSDLTTGKAAPKVECKTDEWKVSLHLSDRGWAISATRYVKASNKFEALVAALAEVEVMGWEKLSIDNIDVRQPKGEELPF